MDFTEQEQAELDETVLEDLPDGYQVPTMERNPDGTLRPGHAGLKKRKPKPITDGQLKRLAKQELKFLTHTEEVNLKREAIHAVIGELEIKKAILDMYRAALNAENPYAKVVLFRLFFEQTVGSPPKQSEMQSTQYQYRQSIDYSKLSQEDLRQLESIAIKVVPMEDNGG
jgi:hypothetical protein